MVGDNGFTLRRVSGFPSAIGLGRIHFVQTGRLHPLLVDQLLRSDLIDLGPLALARARSVANKPRAFVELIQLPINPAVTERAVDGFLARHARYPGFLLRKLEPQPLACAWLVGKPLLPIGRGRACDDWQTSFY